jgi:hypothetical protein
VWLALDSALEVVLGLDLQQRRAGSGEEVTVVSNSGMDGGVVQLEALNLCLLF